MKPASIFSEAARYGDAPALIDCGSRRVIRYSELVPLLESRSRGFPDFVSTWERPVVEHAIRLLAALYHGSFVIPISYRLPEAEARWRAQLLGSFVAPCAGTILATSGSSGKPRAVWHDLEAHIASARASSQQLPLAPGCGWLMSLPLHHVSGFSILIRCLLTGAAVVFPDTSLPYENQISNPEVTHLSVVSTQLARILECGADLKCFRAVLGGGGPFSTDLVSRAIDAGVPLHLTYGMTETASQITTTPLLKQLPSPLHLGKPLRGLEVRISPDGEIQVRGPMVTRVCFYFDGRLEDPTDVDGWLSTGDLGYFSELGDLVVTGRRDRLIISGGENIQPESIESLLMEIPGIRRAVVVPRVDDRFGERPVAFVAGQFEVSDLMSWLAERLESFAIPDAFLPWPESVPVDVPKPDFAFFKRLAARV